MNKSTDYSEHDLVCPTCGSKQSLNRLRSRLEKVRSEQEPVPANWTAGSGNMFYINPTTVITGGSNTFTTNSSILDYSTKRPVNNMALTTDGEGKVILNDAVVDICTNCGTIYSPNINEVAKALLDLLHKLDPLGSLADIVDDD